MLENKFKVNVDLQNATQILILESTKNNFNKYKHNKYHMEKESYQNCFLFMKMTWIGNNRPAFNCSVVYGPFK